MRSHCVLIAQYLAGVFFHLDFFRSENALHNPVLVGDESRAESSHIGAAAHLFLTEDSQFVNQLLFCVRYQGKRQLVFFYETLVRFFGSVEI